MTIRDCSICNSIAEKFMERKNGPWTIQESNRKYRNSFINVREDRVLQPDGQPGIYATVAMKPGVAILPLDRDGIVHLTRQFRYALGKESIEVVCGAIDGDEPPLDAARREVREELGIQAEEWISLGAIDLDTSIICCPVHLFLAQQLTFSETHQEGSEVIKKVKLSWDATIQMVMDSRITHSPSCVLILKASQAYKK